MGKGRSPIWTCLCCMESKRAHMTCTRAHGRSTCFHPQVDATPAKRDVCRCSLGWQEVRTMAHLGVSVFVFVFGGAGAFWLGLKENRRNTTTCFGSQARLKIQELGQTAGLSLPLTRCQGAMGPFLAAATNCWCSAGNVGTQGPLKGNTSLDGFSRGHSVFHSHLSHGVSQALS